jgi:hypothetical protein
VTVLKESPVPQRVTLEIARRALDFDESTRRRMSYEAQDRIMQSTDFLEGPRAFIAIPIG